MCLCLPQRGIQGDGRVVVQTLEVRRTRRIHGPVYGRRVGLSQFYGTGGNALFTRGRFDARAGLCQCRIVRPATRGGILRSAKRGLCL
jgi:hypothetical protein